MTFSTKAGFVANGNLPSGGMKWRAWVVLGLTSGSLIADTLANPPVVSNDGSFSKEGLFKAEVSTLKDTQVLAYADVPLDPTKNVLWCGTMQLAWNKAIDLVGEKLHFTSPSPTADLLNRQDFTAADLDPASYVAVADFEKNNVEDEIRAALQKTFQGAALPELIPEKPTNPRPSDFVAYAYLYKNLSFRYRLSIANLIVFAGKKVEAFGIDSLADPRVGESGKFLEQIAICDYKSPDDFIVELKTTSPNDELLLAKVTPGPTLAATVASVLQRAKNDKPVDAMWGDDLAIPKLNFDLRRDFTELEGLVLEPEKSTQISSNSSVVITKASQVVQLQLNENGAILKSESALVLNDTGEGPPPHIMLFDKPFLILMKRKDSRRPYFAIWIANSSLLVPAKMEDSFSKPDDFYYYSLGQKFFEGRYYDRAIEAFGQGLRLAPKACNLLQGRARAYYEKGDFEGAIKDYSDLIRYCDEGDENGETAKDDKEEAFCALGNIYSDKREYPKALANYNEALQIDSSNFNAYNGRAWIQATALQTDLRDGKQALKDAAQACKITNWANPNFIDTLAVSTAETGDFDGAVRWELYAQSIPNQPADVAEEIKEDLALFQAHKPYPAQQRRSASEY